MLEQICFGHVFALMSGRHGDALARRQWSRRRRDIGVGGSSREVLADRVESSAVEFPADFLLQAGRGPVTSVLGLSYCGTCRTNCGYYQNHNSNELHCRSLLSKFRASIFSM